MILKNNLYQVVEIGADGKSAAVCLNKDCVIYKAHFPEQPVTPGVCLVQMAVEVLELLLNTGFCIKEVINAKFLSVVNPLEAPVVTYTVQRRSEVSGGDVRASFVVSREADVYAKISILLGRR